MAEQDHTEGDATKPVNMAPESAPLRADGMSRRRFAGLGASGVILTLASQPAMANSVMCTALSAPGSVIHSRSTTVVLKCDGLSPGYYHKPANWAGTGVDPNGMFKDYFTTAGLGSLLIPYTLLQVVTGDFVTAVAASDGNGKNKKKDNGTTPPPVSDPDKNNVARHIIATWLNVLSNRVSFFTVESVMAIWTEYATTSHYVPTAGAVPWDGTTLVLHLKDRMT